MPRKQLSQCKMGGCFKPCWCKDMCRPHYRKSIAEGSRRWQRVKNTPELMEKTKMAKKAWDSSPEGKEAKKKADVRYMSKNRDKILAYKRLGQKQTDLAVGEKGS